MKTGSGVQAVETFTTIVSGMRATLDLWTIHQEEFVHSVEQTKLAILGGGNKELLSIKLRTVAGIIAAMHRTSADKILRTVAYDALAELDAFSVATCGRLAANQFRFEEIKHQHMIDCGVGSVGASRRKATAGRASEAMVSVER